MKFFVGCALALTALGLVGHSPAVADSTWRQVGTSHEGAPIRAYVIGDPEADLRVVVLGQMHGDEPAGRRVIESLRALTTPEGTALWLIPSMNPDGHVEQSRTNARGVDLNRNFPTRWRAQGADTRQWSGPRPASEPETQAVMRFLASVQPAAVLSFHQPFAVVDISHASAREAGRRLARWMDLPARVVRCAGPCRGTLTEWVAKELDAVALTVELPAETSKRDTERAAEATMRFVRWLGSDKPN